MGVVNIKSEAQVMKGPAQQLVHLNAKAAQWVSSAVGNHPYTALGIYPFDEYSFNNGHEPKDGRHDFGKYEKRMRTRMKSSH